MPSNVVSRIVIVTVIVFLAFTLRQFTATPPAVDAAHAFNTDRAFSRLVTVLGDESPHPVDSISNDAVRERLLKEIRLLGFNPIVRDDFHCSEHRQAMRCARVQNVMFWVGDQGPNAVMIASHYDSVPAGPGAADDGAGVAASLEIASLLNGRDLSRPVLILITDGEEIGLVGASSFVANDPFAQLVSAVVSMEARGVSGPVAMFQTSTPNGRDVSALKSDIKLASTSSLAADVYELMPNGTDVTQFLALDVDVGNFAIGGSPEFYHTPRDNLAMLDKRSLFHMGVSALNTVEAYLEQSGDEPETQWIYSDVLGLIVLALPQIFALPLIVLGGIAAFIVFVVKGSGSPLKALAVPFVAIVLGLVFAVAASVSVDAIRPEAHYAAAHPWALRAAQDSAALLGALIAVMLLGRSISSTRLLTSAWICFALFGGILSYFVAGAAILFVPSLIVIALAGLLMLLGKDKSAYVFAMLAAVLFLLIVVPTSALAEVMLFVEYAAPFTLLLVFCFVLLLPLVLPATGFQKKLSWKLPGIGLCIVLFFTVMAMVVPAHSPNAPRSLSIIHAADLQSGNQKFIALTSAPLPSAMQDIAQFELGEVAGFKKEQFVADAPSFETSGLDIQIERKEGIEGERVLKINILAPDSNIIQGNVVGDRVTLNSMTINGVASTLDDTAGFTCHGRSCRSITLAISLSMVDVESGAVLEVNGYRYGLGVEGEALLSARPDSALARSWGDLRRISKTVGL